MSTSNIDPSDRLRVERLAVETLYRAFSEKNPDLVDAVLAANWDDIPLAATEINDLEENQRLAVP